MTIIVDTNIVFSALLNPKSIIGELLLNVQDKVEYVAPTFIITELEKYHAKILKYAKIKESDLLTLKANVLSSLKLFNEKKIKKEFWELSYNLLKEIDQKDIPFLALTLQLKGHLWTGDKKLKSKIQSNFQHSIITTNELKAILF